VFPDNPPFSRPDIPAVDPFPPVGGASGGQIRHGDPRGQAGSPGASVPVPGLSPELIRRFHALVEEVTDELMQDPQQDRIRCRADAITLLMATCEQVDDFPEPGQSPLQYLLIEEQRKALAALGRAAAPDEASTFLRA
jgi:hypothetical protein